MEKKTKIIELTLGFLIEGNEVWLATKADKIGKGKLNGFGGKIEKGETPEECMERELFQECGVIALKKYFEKVAVNDFYNMMENGEEIIFRVHTYFIRFFKGEPQETKEMLDPKKFLIDNIPFQKLMLADIEWLPLVFNGLKIIGKFYYGPNQEQLIKKSEIKIVKMFPNN
jgi:8-oxo-dGTP pyrophosphatase MutT (NUDIX family)